MENHLYAADLRVVVNTSASTGSGGSLPEPLYSLVVKMAGM